MKKVLAWVLLLTLVMSLFAGCRNNEPEVTEPPVKGPGAADAIEYLKGFYTDSGKQTPVDYTRFGIVRVGGIAFDVVWTVDVGEDLVKVVANDDGTVTIDINEECEADTEYTLTATITDAQGKTASHSWTYILPEGVDMVEVVKAAYALKPGESLPYDSRLTGKIISLDAVWSDDYQNVTVTIEVEGTENMPIKCYRMKANDATLEAAKNLKVGNIITVTGTLKNYEGTIEFDAGCILEKVEKGDAIEAPTDPGEILKAAYALPQDTALPYQATLTGTVTEIDVPYDPQYGNISVVITVEGHEKYPMLCYRLKGNEADKIAIGDLITVTGIIKNYKGTIEYDAGCIMTKRVSGGGVAQGPSSDPNKIIPDALKLGVGEKLPYRATLTGEIISVDTPYDPGYANVTVTIKVNGVKFQCYRMVGDGIDQIRESDTITVSGVIENYNGKLEFGARCTLDNWVKGPRTINYGPLKEDIAYRLYVNQESLGKTLYFTGDYSGSRLKTSDKGSQGVDIFVERVSGRGMSFYFMDGNTKNYIGVEDYTTDEGKVRGRTCVTTSPVVYWIYNADLGVYLAEVGAGKHFMGAYGSYDTISASWVGYIDGTYSSGNQYVAKFMKASDVPADDAPQGGTGVMVTAPEVGVPYKWGLNQENKNTHLYFTGKMSGYYGATTDNINDAIDVYLEEVPGGGYYVTFTDDSGAKKYVTVVVEAKDGKTYRNFTIASAPSTVYTYNTEYNTLVTSVDGDDVYIGTYNDFNTFSVSFFSKISSSFPAHFYTIGEGGEVEPDEPDVPSTPKFDVEKVDDPIVEVPYKLYSEQGNLNKTLFFAGTTANKEYYFSTTEDGTAGTDVYLESADGGYYLYFMQGNNKTYIDMVQSGTFYNLKMSSNPGVVYTFDEQYHTLVANVSGTDCYIGTYKEYETLSCSAYSYISGSFPCHLGLVSETIEPDVTEPDVTEPSEPVVEGETMVVALYSPEYNKALTTVNPDKGYGYFPGTDITITQTEDMFMVEGLIETNVLILIDNGDDTTVKIMDCYGRYLYNTGNYNNFSLSTEVPESGADWIVTADEEAQLLYFTNAATGKTIGYDPSYGSFGVYKEENMHIGLSLILIVDEEEPDVTEPDVSEPAGDGFAKVTSADQFTTGEYVMIVDTGYAPGVFDNGWLSAVEPVVDGNVIADTKDAVWTLTVNGDSVVITDANGVSIAPKGGNSNGVLEGDYDWAWSFENGKFVFAGAGSDTVYLASNATTTGQYPGNHRFRGYKTTTVNGQPENFLHQFTLYKLGGEYVEPEVTEPEVTEPATEPSGDQTGMITAPEIGVAYKWGIEQKTLGKTLYFNGAMAKTYYGGTTENVAEAVDVYLEAADGGYYVTFTEPTGAKKYINIVVNGTHKNFTIADRAVTVYTWDQEHNTLNADVDGETCYIGTYGNYDTFSISTIDKIGNSYPSHFYGEGGSSEPEATEPEATEPSGDQTGMITAPEIGVAYKWGIEQKTLGKTLYFNGAMAKTYYGGTTENVDEAVDVYLEAADGGYYVTFTEPTGAKKYINIVVNGTHKNFTIADRAVTVYTWDQEHNTLNADVDGATCYIGTYGNYDTFSISTIDKIGNSYPSHFYGEGGSSEPEATEPEATEPAGSGELEVGVAYKVYSEQANVKKTLYFAGTTANQDYYFSTTEDPAAATDVYLEAANGGYYMYFMKDGVKTYIDMVQSGTFFNLKMTSKPGVVYTYDSQYKTLVANVAGTDCYMGTYNQYETLSCSKYSYISGSFPCHFSKNGETVEPDVSEPEETTPTVGGESVSVNFAVFPKGEQYAEESYDLGGGITLDISHCHMNSQLRIYQDSKNGYDGKAIFSCGKVLQSVTLNAGYRVSTLEVYASEDGENWEKIYVIDHPTKDGYADYTIEMPAGSNYKYLMLDAPSTQMRVKTMTFIFKK